MSRRWFPFSLWRSRYRPRVLTMFVFVAAVAVIVLSNLSFDETSFADGNGYYRSYGWPLIWHRVVIEPWENKAVGWYYSAPRLASSVALWLALLAALTGGCEWSLRRYRPRPRWSLRTLLIFIALVALACSWYTKVRRRAEGQDSIIVAMRSPDGAQRLFVERWGPKWLDLLGLDRFRRRIVLASYWKVGDAAQKDVSLSQLSDLRYLGLLETGGMTPAIAEALRGMRELRTLGIRVPGATSDLAAALDGLRGLRNLSISVSQTSEGPPKADEQVTAECFAAVGKMTRLETLSLSHLRLGEEALACLAGLPHLRSLDLDFGYDPWKAPDPETPDIEACLRSIAALPSLEQVTLRGVPAGSGKAALAALAGVKNVHWLCLKDMALRKEDLALLSDLPNLRTLTLENLNTEDHPLSHLPMLARLEALMVSDLRMTDDDLGHVTSLPRLKTLSLADRPNEFASHVTPTGLASLGSLESLEEVTLEGSYESPQSIAALVAVKRLKKLNLGGRPWPQDGDEGSLILDDGQELVALDLESTTRALQTLRQARPGIVVEMNIPPIFLQRDAAGDLPDTNRDMFPERPRPGVPGGETEWMTPAELAAFEKKGGRASFHGASWPTGMGNDIISVKF
jgi:Leucine-rich repeat (LRR) protein